MNVNIPASSCIPVLPMADLAPGGATIMKNLFYKKTALIKAISSYLLLPKSFHGMPMK